MSRADSQWADPAARHAGGVRLMDRVLDPFFRAVMHEWVPWTLAGVIVAYGVLEFLRLFLLLRPIRRSVKAALDYVGFGSDPRRFVERYEEVNAKLSGDRWLGAAWTEFS